MKKEIYNYAINPDENTLEQFEHCTSQKFVLKAALMPDAHSGYVAPIGSVLVTKDYIVPSWVGYDIGCGMTAVQLKGKNILEKINEKKNELYEKVNETIPMGKGKINERKDISEETKKEYEKLIEKFKKKPYDKEVLQFLEGKSIQHLGSLGHGNHFVEIGSFEKEAWVVVHSGSRGVGFKVAQRYMKKSAGNEKDFEQTFPISKESEIGKEFDQQIEFEVTKMDLGLSIILGAVVGGFVGSFAQLIGTDKKVKNLTTGIVKLETIATDISSTVISSDMSADEAFKRINNIEFILDNMEAELQLAAIESANIRISLKGRDVAIKILSARSRLSTVRDKIAGFDIEQTINPSSSQHKLSTLEKLKRISEERRTE